MQLVMPRSTPINWPERQRRSAVAGAGLALLIAAATPAPAQQWSIQDSEAPVHWRTCRIVSPAYTGPCQVTFLTRGNRSLNIHFDRDATGTEGLSFVIAARDRQLEPRMEFQLVAERFASNNVREIDGQCSIRPEAIRCVSADGQFSAQAVGRLR